MNAPGPILVSPLFRELHGHLLDLLRSLSPEDWHRPTVCSAWCVKDIAGHLLDGDLRRLAIQRDGYAPPDAPTGFDSHEALVTYLHRLNADWTAATRRISPRSLIRLLEVTGEEVADLFEAADPVRPGDLPGRLGGRVGVADVVRHRQGVHRAVAPPAADRPGRGAADADRRPPPLPPGPGDLPAGLALHVPGRGRPGRVRPSASRSPARPGATGSSAGREAAGSCGTSPKGHRTSTVVIDQADAWLLFTKRTDRATARARFPSIRVEGDTGLGEIVLEMVSIMA